MAKTKLAPPKELKRRAVQVAKILDQEYPDAECALYHETPEQLLFATILSAQCTDKQVNKVTPNLFKKYPSVESLAKAKISALENVVRSTGFYKNKAKNLKACAQSIVDNHGGQLPKTLEELTSLAGVGRKTANVVLGNAFDIPGMVVDTHVKRLSNLIGLTQNADPVKIEYDLMELLPKDKWTMFSHWLILHGRSICVARRPKCGDCVVKNYCEYGRKSPEEQ